MAGNLYYILNEKKEPVPEPDVLTWGKWMEKAQRIVAQDQVGKYFVSTIFLGLDHSMSLLRPILFETMIFDTSKRESMFEDLWQERCATWAEAEEMHRRALVRAKEGGFAEEEEENV